MLLKRKKQKETLAFGLSLVGKEQSYSSQDVCNLAVNFSFFWEVWMQTGCVYMRFLLWALTTNIPEVFHSCFYDVDVQSEVARGQLKDGYELLLHV